MSVQSYLAPELIRWMDGLDECWHQEHENLKKPKKYGIYKVGYQSDPQASDNSLANDMESERNLVGLAVNTSSYYCALAEFEKQMRCEEKFFRVYNPFAEDKEETEDKQDKSDTEDQEDEDWTCEINIHPPFTVKRN